MNNYDFPCSGSQHALNAWARVALTDDNPDVVLHALNQGLRNQLIEFYIRSSPVFLLDHAIYAGHNKTADLLLSDARIDVRMGAPVFYATLHGNAALVRRLIAQGADISARALVNGVYKSALHIANLEMSQLLVDLGADLAVVDSLGHDAISNAIVDVASEKFIFLLSVDTRNINRRVWPDRPTTLFDIAMQWRCPTIVWTIVEQKSVDIFTNASYATYFHLIQQVVRRKWCEPGGQLLRFKRLIELGADMDKISQQYLQFEAYPDLVSMALVCGASLSPTDFQIPMYRKSSESPSRRLVENWCSYQNGPLCAASRQTQLGVGGRLGATVQRLLRAQVDLIRHRAAEVLIGLQSQEISAGELLEIIEFACEPFSNCVPPHIKWQLIVTVKHFHDRANLKVSTTAHSTPRE